MHTVICIGSMKHVLTVKTGLQWLQCQVFTSFNFHRGFSWYTRHLNSYWFSFKFTNGQALSEICCIIVVFDVTHSYEPKAEWLQSLAGVNTGE